MAFATLVGQSDLKARLGSILAQEPGHAYVLTGPTGIGKTTFATEFAQALLCHQPSEAGACGICSACHHFTHQAHPDFRTLLLDSKDKVIKVERVRQTVQADIALRPQFGQRKVYLIDADYLNEQGQNTLLKSLEEPPQFVTFVLMTQGPEKLLPTILSRLTVLPLRRYPTADVIEILHRELDLQNLPRPDEATLGFYARYANGIPGTALNLITSSWFADLRQETIEFYSQIGRLSRAQILTTGYTFFDSNRARADVLLDIIGSLTRDQLVLAVTNDSRHLTNSDQEQRLTLPQTKQRHDAVPGLIRATAAIATARRGLKLNASFEGLACQLLLTLRKELIHA
ncbi:MAG: AAA family ATPase [Eubacteriales bacterium]|nr:AAA family ATPase [Eubacteriales bacterium]